MNVEILKKTPLREGVFVSAVLVVLFTIQNVEKAIDKISNGNS